MNIVLNDFINSDLTESDYFGLSKEELITIKEYFLEMRDKDKEFKELIKEPLDSMKDKCGWINTVGYYHLQNEDTGSFFRSTIYLFPVDGKTQIVHKEYDGDKYVDQSEKFLKIHLLNKDIRKEYNRGKEVVYIQDELREIDKIGHAYYDGELHSKKSISDSFEVSYMPNMGMHVYVPSTYETLASYYIRNFKSYDKPLIKDEQKEKVLTKIQIRK